MLPSKFSAYTCRGFWLPWLLISLMWASALRAVPACPDPTTTGLPPMTWPMGLVPPGQSQPMPGFGIGIMQKFNNYNCHWSSTVPGHENDKYHEAIDLVEDVDPEETIGAQASAVYAAWPGFVECVGRSSSGASGFAVTLRHPLMGTSLYTVYHHLDRATYDYWSTRAGTQLEQGAFLGQLTPSSGSHYRHLHFVVRTFTDTHCPIGWGYQPAPVTSETGYCDPFEFFARTQVGQGAVVIDSSKSIYALPSTASRKLGDAAAATLFRLVGSEYSEEVNGLPQSCGGTYQPEDSEIRRHWQEVESLGEELWKNGWISASATYSWGGDSGAGAFRGVDLIEPDSAWYHRQPQTLRWVNGGLSTVNLHLVAIPAGTVTLLAEDVPAADESYTFQVPMVPNGTYRLEIRDARGSGAMDTSGPIDIGEAGITVLAPVAEDTWYRASSYNVLWSSTGVSGNVKIELLNENAVVLTIASSATNNGSFSFRLPSPQATGARTLRICNLAATVCSLPVPLTVASPTISVTAPTASTICYKNGPCTIAWSAPGNENIRLELYQDQFLSRVIAAQATDTGNFSWHVPSDLDSNGDYRVKATLVSGLASAYSSFFQVQLQPQITVTQPTSGATWLKGSPRTISWTAANAAGRVDIDLLRGATSVRLASNYEPGGTQGNFTWTPPINQATGTYQMRICRTSGSPCGTASFSIANPTLTIQQPTSGAFWKRGTTKTITWQAPGVTERINIRILMDLESSTQIVSNTENDGSHSWNIPTDFVAGSYVMWVCTSSGAACASTQLFISRLTIHHPSGGAVWYVGRPMTFTWSTAGLPGNVRLEILSPAAVYPLVSSTPNDNSEATIVPSLPNGNNYQARICHIDSGICSTSGSFSIVTPQIAVTTPAQGQAFFRGQTYQLQWSAPLVTEGLEIQVYEGSIPVYPPIASPTPNDGSQSWTVPASLPPGPYRMKFALLSGAATTWRDFSIEIPASIEVTSPAGGATWLRGSSYDITWISWGVPGNVKIELRRYGSTPWVIHGDTSNDGHYNWQVPTAVNPGSYEIWVCSLGTTACGHSPMQVSNPTIDVGSQSTLYHGDSVNLTWSAPGVNEGVRLDLMDAGPVHTISPGTANSGSFSWVVASFIPPSSYYLRVCTLSGSACGNSGNFNIASRPSIAVLNPAAGANWYRGQVHDIWWTSTQITGNVRIELMNGGDVEATIAADTANDYSHSWPIPATGPTGFRQIRICKVDGSICDSSETFNLMGLPLPTWISVTSTGGSTWIPGRPCQVQWTANSGGGDVRIWLETIGGSSAASLAERTPNDYQLDDCTVPNVVGGPYKVRVESYQNPTVRGYSSQVNIINN